MTKKLTPEEMLRAKHSNRWRPFGNGVPSIVSRAFNGDVATPLGMSNAEVFANVNAWLIEQGAKPLSKACMAGKASGFGRKPR